MANAVLDGVDGIMLGAETLRGQYPVEAVSTVLGICRQVSVSRRVSRRQFGGGGLLVVDPIIMGGCSLVVDLQGEGG